MEFLRELVFDYEILNTDFRVIATLIFIWKFFELDSNIAYKIIL